MAYFKHRIARLTRGKWLGFGYTPAEVKAKPTSKSKNLEQDPSHAHTLMGATLSSLYALRPQTLSFSLCDSPVGLLAGLLDIIHTRAPEPTATSPVTSRSRSPFLSPVELEMEESRRGSGEDEVPRTASTEYSPPFSPRESELNARIYTWSPTEVLNWTMLQWLPGPEGSLVSKMLSS